MDVKRSHMSQIRLAVLALLIMTTAAVAFAEPQGAAGAGPALGNWEFTGKDNAGLPWSGTLKIRRIDPVRFPGNYYAYCALEDRSTDDSKGVHGVEAPCTWDSGTRTLPSASRPTQTRHIPRCCRPTGRRSRGESGAEPGTRA